MAKKRRTSSSTRRVRRTKNYGAAQTLTTLGGIIALIGFILGLVGSAPNIVGMLMNLIGIVITVLILISTGLIKSRKTYVPFNWWVLLILAVVQIILNGSYMNLVGLGVLLEIIAVVLLLIDAM